MLEHIKTPKSKGIISVQKILQLLVTGIIRTDMHLFFLIKFGLIYKRSLGPILGSHLATGLMVSHSSVTSIFFYSHTLHLH